MPYTAGPSVQITRPDGGKSVFETYLYADPHNASHLMAAAIIKQSGAASNAFFVSFESRKHLDSDAFRSHSVDPAISTVGSCRARMTSSSASLNRSSVRSKRSSPRSLTPDG